MSFTSDGVLNGQLGIHCQASLLPLLSVGREHLTFTRQDLYMHHFLDFLSNLTVCTKNEGLIELSRVGLGHINPIAPSIGGSRVQPVIILCCPVCKRLTISANNVVNAGHITKTEAHRRSTQLIVGLACPSLLPILS